MSGEKTEQPTEKRKKDSRKRGEVAKSQDLTTGILLLGLGVTLVATQERTMGILRDSMLRGYRDAFRITGEDPGEVLSLLTSAAGDCIKVITPVLAVGFALAFLGSVAQVGFLFASESFKPKFEKLDPIKGLKSRLFSGKAYLELGKSVLKILVIAVVLHSGIRGSLDEIGMSLGQEPVAVWLFTCKLLAGIVYRVGAVFLLLALGDVFVQRWQHMKQMRMSKDEVKREYKESEGDPLLKGMRKQMHEEMLAGNLVHGVKSADVVIVNPTHIAVALQYRKERMSAPRVTAKGEMAVARRIIATARKHGIPVTRNIPLAHALNVLEIGQEIPEDLYEATAEVLNWVYQQSSTRR
jgi:flagellar biosynthetic protein FlhB